MKFPVPEPLRFMPARIPGPTFDTTALWSPLSLFRLFFSNTVINTLIANTNANALKRLQAGKKMVWKVLTQEESALGIIIFSGLVHVHKRTDYWRTTWPYNFSFPADKMSRNRFETIMWSLHMSNPEEGDEKVVKRIIRYLEGRLRVAIRYEFQEESKSQTVYTDSGWAEYEVTRRSTSGGVVCLGSHTLSW